MPSGAELMGRQGVSAIEERYDAFISYNHAADAELAVAVERGLQRLAKPWYKLRALSIFRDLSDTGLNPSLWGTVQRQLDGSRWLILLACPESAASRWVNQELTYWCDTRGSDGVLLVLTGGELVWDRAAGAYSPTSNALAPEIAIRFASEPLHLDLRWARDVDPAPSLSDRRFRSQMARLASPIRDLPPDEIESEDLRLHRIARRLARGAIAGLVTLALATSVAAVLAIRNANEAERRAREATARQLGLLALDMPASDLDRALLFSVAAAELDPTRDVERFRPGRTLLGRHSRLTAMLHVPDHLRRPSVGDVATSPSGERVAAMVSWMDASHVVVGWNTSNPSRPTTDPGDASPRSLGVDDGGEVTTFPESALAIDAVGRRAIVAGAASATLIDPGAGDAVLAEWPGTPAAAAIGGGWAAVVAGRTLHLADARSGAPLAMIELAEPARAIAVTGDGTVVVATAGGAITWWHSDRRALEQVSVPVDASVVGVPSQLAVDSSGRHVVAVGSSGAAFVDGERGTVGDLDAHTGVLAVDPSGRFAAVGGSGLTIWDLTTGGRAVVVAEEVNDMAWSACAGSAACRLVTAGEAIVVWEPATGRRVLLADQTNAQAVDLSADGETIVSGGWGSSIAVWRMTTPVDRAARAQVTAGDRPSAFDAASGIIAAVVGDPAGGAVDLTGNARLRIETGPVETLRLLAGGSRLLVEHDSDLRLFDTGDGHQLTIGCGGDLWAVSPTGRRLVTFRTDDQAASVCDTATGERVARAQIPGAAVTAVAIDDTGLALARGGAISYHVVAGGRIGAGQAVDVRFGDEHVETGPVTLHRGRLAAGVRPVGGRGEMARVLVWNAADRGTAVQFETDHAQIAAVALIGDQAELLAVAGRADSDGAVVVQVWESESRRRLGRGLDGLVGDVTALTGDAGQVIGTDAAGRTWRWSLTHDPATEICEIVGRDLSEDEWQAVGGGMLRRYDFGPVCA